jgi:hypothetical protein
MLANDDMIKKLELIKIKNKELEETTQLDTEYDFKNMYHWADLKSRIDLEKSIEKKKQFNKVQDIVLEHVNGVYDNKHE